MRIVARVSVALALLLAPPLGAVAPRRDWSRVAIRQPDGSFVEGNPKAKVKLVEYLSYTCPHCAHLEGEAIQPLTAKYIRTGLVSYEVRHAIRDAFDFSATLLARCSGPRAFFTITPVVYARQDEWIAQGSKWSETAPADLAPSQVMLAAAKGAGLDALFAAHGLPAARAAACLTDMAEQKRLSMEAKDAWARPNFPGTPAFLIDGAPADGIGSWAELDQKLAAALKS